MRELKVSLLAAFLFSLLCSNLVYSQDKTTEFNPLAENKWAVVFEAGTLLRGSSGDVFKNFLLTGKYHFNKKHAVRLFGGTSGYKSDGNEKGYNQPDLNRISESFYIETGLQYVRYLNPDSRVKVYLAAGPYYTFDYSNSNRDDAITGSWYSYYYSKEWNLGIAGSLGVEYIILDNISLIGEYFISATAGKTIGDSRYAENYQWYSSESTNYRIRFNKMQIGLSVYF